MLAAPSLSHIIRRFNRFELKHQMTLKTAERFKESLRAYLLPDNHGDGQGSYWLSSLYYDSPDYRCYWEKIDGIRFRRKLRIRQYENAGGASVFVEIKQRANRVTQKRRAALPYPAALALCSQRQRPDCPPADQAVLDEVYTLLWQYDMRPASLIRYQRQALVGTDYDLGLRVTFDTQLEFSLLAAHQTDPFAREDAGSFQPLLPPDSVVMEIKANERVPYWLTELVGQHNLTLVRISKYCQSITLAQKG